MHACEVQLRHLGEKKELIADGEGTQIYFPPFYYAEVGIANKLHILLGSSFSRLAFYRDANWPAVFTWLDLRNPFRLSQRQKEAVELALTKQVAILTGGPGTGKSTVTGTIIKLLAPLLARNRCQKGGGQKEELFASSPYRASGQALE